MKDHYDKITMKEGHADTSNSELATIVIGTCEEKNTWDKFD